MEYKKLGNTDIEVSKLCFGSLTITPSQANLSISEGSRLINFAYDNGINFIDTAEIYENYEYIREALKYIPRDKFVITSKTYAYTSEMADESLNLALKELGTDYIDLFLLHEQESEMTLKGHYEALERLFALKEKGYIRGVGISTHKIAALKASEQFKEIEVIHPMINKYGLGILDGTRDEMLDEIKKARTRGVGIYAMKVIGGGHLISEADEAIKWANNIEYFDSMAIGMQSEEEVLNNIAIINNREVSLEIKSKLRTHNRTIDVEDYCIACGNCEKRCQAEAIKVIDGMARINENCIMCGYCATVCPEFCIKVY
ncbi:MAG: aldo/keto reductase [Tissierellia bacterium]|nr:aldo/keto reductase [Tissierellia bacterium]